MHTVALNKENDKKTMHKPEMLSHGSMKLHTLEGLKGHKSVLFSHKLGQHVHQKAPLKKWT